MSIGWGFLARLPEQFLRMSSLSRAQPPRVEDGPSDLPERPSGRQLHSSPLTLTDFKVFLSLETFASGLLANCFTTEPFSQPSFHFFFFWDGVTLSQSELTWTNLCPSASASSVTGITASQRKTYLGTCPLLCKDVNLPSREVSSSYTGSSGPHRSHSIPESSCVNRKSQLHLILFLLPLQLPFPPFVIILHFWYLDIRVFCS